MNKVGSVSGIGAPISPDCIGGEEFIRYIGDKLVLIFCEGGGSVTKDLSGGGNNGRFKSLHEPKWEKNCVLFDGVDDVINCGRMSGISNIFDDGGTIVAYINVNSTGAHLSGSIVSKADLDLLDEGWYFWVTNQSGKKFSLNFFQAFDAMWGEWLSGQLGDRPINIKENTLVVIRYNSNSTRNNPDFIKNIKSLNLWETTAPVGKRQTDSEQDLLIGAETFSFWVFDGRISFIRVNSMILSDIQILQDYLWNKWRN